MSAKFGVCSHYKAMVTAPMLFYSLGGIFGVLRSLTKCPLFGQQLGVGFLPMIISSRGDTL